jgi:hypothetical protein
VSTTLTTTASGARAAGSQGVSDISRGGFAGGKPVGQPENFRCAFNKAQGDYGSFE